MRMILIILLWSNVYTCCAQHTTAIPAAVKTAFAISYTGAGKVKWDKEDAKYEASFCYKNQDISVLYNADGSIAETETEIPVDALPANARQYAAARGRIKEAARIERADGTVRYEAQVRGKDLMFDDKGFFISKNTK